MILLVVIWKPYYLFKNGFKQSVIIYWKHIITHYMLLLLCLGGNLLFANMLAWKAEPTFVSLLTYAVCLTLPTVLLYTVFVYFFTPGMKELVYRLPIITKIQNRLFK